MRFANVKGDAMRVVVIMAPIGGWSRDGGGGDGRILECLRRERDANLVANSIIVSNSQLTSSDIVQ